MVNEPSSHADDSVADYRAFAVIGDVVASREHSDQAGLFGAIEQHLAWVNERHASAVIHPLTMTIGDEFQGAFSDLETALLVVLTAQLRVAELTQLRFGVGHGDMEQLADAEFPRGQSGSAWWAARNAIDRVKQLQESKQAYRSCAFESVDRRLGAPVEAFLVLRDRLLHDFDDHDTVIALGLVLGRTQSSTAHDLGIDPAAVSRRKYGHGIAALLDAHRALGGGTRWLR